MIFVLVAAVVVAQVRGDGGVPGVFADAAVGVGVLGVAYLFFRIQRSMIGGLERQLRECRAESRLANWRIAELQAAVARTGATVREDRWNPPHLVREDGTLILDPPDE